MGSGEPSQVQTTSPGVAAAPQYLRPNGVPLTQEIAQVWNCTLALRPDSQVGWETIDFRQNVKIVSGTGIMTTQSFKPIQSETMLTVNEEAIYIQTASWYGAREWNDCYWFSAANTAPNASGILSVTKSDTPQSNFYPFQGMSSDIFPLIVPSCSKPGENGYVCIFESSLDGLGVSLWDINSQTPKQLFRQTDFQSTNFVGNKLFGIKLDTNEFQCWNLETRSLEYSLKGWWENSPNYASLRPYSTQQNMLFADAGSWIYAFDLNKKELAYKFELPIISGIGFFHKVLVGNNMIYFREYSCERVMVYEISTGKLQSAFHISGGSDNLSSDDYPTCVYGDAIVALKVGDRKTVCFYNAKTGNPIKEFGPAPEIITGVYCTENRVIASCQCTTEKVPEGYLDQVVIWDIKSGLQLKVIKAPDNCYMSPQDITNGLLTLYIDPKDSQKKKLKKCPDNTAGPKKLVEKKKLPMESAKDDFHWTNPLFLQLLDNQIRLQIWDTVTCTVRGEFLETFTPNTSVPIFANYESGKLVADLENDVLVQQYK